MSPETNTPDPDAIYKQYNLLMYGREEGEDYQRVVEMMPKAQQLLTSLNDDELLEFHRFAAVNSDESGLGIPAELRAQFLDYLDLNDAESSSGEGQDQSQRLAMAVESLDVALTQLPFLDTDRAVGLYAKALTKDDLPEIAKAVYVSALPRIFFMDPERGVSVAELTLGLQDPVLRKMSADQLSEISEIMDGQQLPGAIFGQLDSIVSRLNRPLL